MKADLHDLYISAAKELELDGGRKAIIIFVPFRQLKDFHKIQARLVRELEKKFRLVNFSVNRGSLGWNPNNLGNDPRSPS